jgi:hypothetical protein
MGSGRRRSLLVFFFVLFLVVIVFGEIAILAGLALLVFFVLVVGVLRDDVEVNGMGLRDFELGLAFWATEDLALFDFVFVDVDLGGTIGAADHGYILRRDCRKGGAAKVADTPSRIIYRGS